MSDALRKAAGQALAFLTALDQDDNDRDFLHESQCRDIDRAMKALRAALAPVAVEPVSSRHPVVVHWRNDGIEACAGIADAYGSVRAARDMRAMITPPPAEVPLLSDREIKQIARESGLEKNEMSGEVLYALKCVAQEQAARRNAGLKWPSGLSF